MAEFLLDVQAPSATPAAGTSLLFPHASNKLWAQKDDTGRVTTLIGIGNTNLSNVVASAADTYLTGSPLAVPSHGLQIGTRFRWRMWMTKTAAGTAAPVWNVRFGTAGTIADAARLTFTGPAQTAVVDTGYVTIDAVVRSIGGAGVVAGVLILNHNLATTGFANLSSPTLQVVSAGFDTTVPNLIVGVSVNPGASGVWTHQGVSSEMHGI